MKKSLFLSLSLILIFALGSVYGQSGFMLPGTYDDSESYFYYSGLHTQNTAVPGYYNETNTQNAYTYFEFVGTGFIVYGRKHEFSPLMVEVCVYSDDIPEVYYCEMFDTSSLEGDSVGELFRFDGFLVYGHWQADFSTFYSGEGYDEQTTFDYIEILDAAAVTAPSPTNTPDPTFYYFDVLTEEGSQTVSLQYSMTAGDVFIGMGLFALVSLMSISLVVWLWKR